MSEILEERSAFKPLPTRVDQFDTQGFLAWLAKHGAEIGIPSNPYEVLRYRAYPYGGGKLQTHVVYAKQTGELTWCGDTQDHYKLFRARMPFTEQPTKPQGHVITTYPTKAAQTNLKAATRERLLERDGDECWFCGRPMGSDQTIEHLVPKSSGGRNMLANYALAHRVCNNRAADLPLIQKIEMRQRMRGQ